jgi:hypothetical protein
VPEQTVEVYIDEAGGSVLFQSFPELTEIMEEIGEFEFGFTPYCG